MKKEIKIIPRNISYISNLIINDCYGVPDKLKFGLTEGWSLTKYYLILCDTEEGFKHLFSALQDIFVNYSLKTTDNENSGIGINEDLFFGELDKEDISYIPELKKIVFKNDKTTLFKFHKQTIAISLDPKEIFSIYDGDKHLTENDIGFFSIKKGNISFATQLSDYQTTIDYLKETYNSPLDFLNALYECILKGYFLFKSPISFSKDAQNSLLEENDKENDKEKLLIEITKLSDILNKKRHSMKDVVNMMYDDILNKNATIVPTSDEKHIENIHYEVSEEIINEE